MILSYSQGMFEYPKKPRFPFKPGPTLKDLLIHDDYAHYLWYDGKWFAKLIYDISMIGIEMKHLSVWELYNIERFSSIWMHSVFPPMFFRNKMRIDLNLIFLFCEFPFCAFNSHCCILKNVVLISLGIDSLQSMFTSFKSYLFYTYTIVICNFSLLCLRTRKILGWGELISAKFQLFWGLNC